MRPYAKMSRKHMQQWCDAFNRENPIGSTIKVWPGARTGDPLDVQIVEPGAYIMSGHTAVVQVTGGHGCIALTHVAS